MRAMLFLGILMLGSSCSRITPPTAEIVTEPGRHPLPFRPNEEFVLMAVEGNNLIPLDPETSYQLVYFLKGKKRTLTLTRKGDGDDYVTYLGPLYDNEIPGMESAIMMEHVIRLASGEEITIDGNTVNPNGIRLRPFENREGQP